MSKILRKKSGEVTVISSSSIINDAEAKNYIFVIDNIERQVPGGSLVAYCFSDFTSFHNKGWYIWKTSSGIWGYRVLAYFPDKD